MPTRREALFNILSTPLAAALVEHPFEPAPAQPEIISELHCLSEESGNGFRLLLSRSSLASTASSPNIMIVPAARKLSYETGQELLRHVIGGIWLILESGLPFVPRGEAIEQLRVLRDVFGFHVQHPVPVSASQVGSGAVYISYSWPLRRLIRDFGMFTPVECSRAERIAEFGGVTVCAKRPVGKGGIIFLGSMLGPGLLAEEREAHELGSAMLRSV
jgi:hypothetical protein